MFGGLDIKSGSSNDQENGSSAATTAAAAAPPAGASAFGFLNAAPAAPAAPAPDAAPSVGMSGFSFLNASAPAPEPTPAPAAPSPAPAVDTASSGFSFLNSMPTTAPAPASEPVSVPAPAPVATSGFSFMIPSPTDNGEESATITSPTTEAAAPPAAADATTAAPTSAFSFMSSPTPESTAVEPSIPPPAPPAAAISSSSSISSTPAAPAPATAPSSSSALPAGAGVKFGTATAPNKIRKKKSRAHKVGAQASTMSIPAPAAVAPATTPPPAPAPAPAPTPAVVENEQPKSARDGALDAARRAEEFMQQKAVEEAQKGAVPSTPAGKSTNADSPPAIAMSPSTDEVLVAAKKAAVEAKAIEQQQKHSGGFMGTFFKGFGGSSNSSLGSSNGSSSAAGTSSAGRRPSAATKAAPPAPSTNGSNVNKSVDRLAQQQKDMKRAMAERQMQMQQEQQKETKPVSSSAPPVETNHNDGTSTVTASNSTSGYQPEPYQPEPYQPEPPRNKVETSVVPAATTSATYSSDVISNSFAPPRETVNIVVRELHTPPKKTKTAVQKFEEYEALFAQSVIRAMQQVENVRSQQKMLLEERFVSIAKDRLSTQQIQQTESQLQLAVEEEDYELADQLGQVVDAHNREKAEVAQMLESISAGLSRLESEKTLVVQGVASCFKNLNLRLKELQESEASHDASNDPETLKQFASISKQLSAEHERLQTEQKLLERDERLLTEEREEVEAAISEQTGEIETQRDEVMAKLSDVEQEIEELRKKLLEKQAEAASLRTDMHGMEDAIAKVRVKFSGALNRVDKKERAQQENRFDWETEQTSYLRQKEAHELQVKTHSEAMLAHDTLMESLDSELKLSAEFAELLPAKLGFMEDESEDGHAEGPDKSEGDLAQMQANVVKCEAAVGEAKILLKAASATLANLEAEHERLIVKIPQLEAEKKAAAGRRDFRSAGKASKEIKECTSRLKECEEEMVGEAANRKQSAEEELKRLDAELIRTRKVAEEKEKESAISKMATLAKKIQQLLATKSELCGETTSSENTVRGVGAMVLDGQIKALRVEGEDLGSKYGGWEEAMQTVDGGHGASETVKKEASEAEKAAAEPITTEGEEAAVETTAAPAESADDGLTREERIASVKTLMRRIKEAEEALEAAVVREDYDEAAELQDVFDKLQADLEKINLTDEEMELALADDEDEHNDDDGEMEIAFTSAPSAEEEDDGGACGTAEETTPPPPQQEQDEETTTNENAAATSNVTQTNQESTDGEEKKVENGDDNPATEEDKQESAEAATTEDEPVAVVGEE